MASFSALTAPRLVRCCLLLLAAIVTGCGPLAEPATVVPSSGFPPGSLQVVATAKPTVIVIDPYLQRRLDLVQYGIQGLGVRDQDVLQAMRTVPRHMFVPDEYLDQAYANHPLPIGYGQTISQPYIVAWMTELLDLRPGERVLEIGTGSGYQAAILAQLGYVEVYSIEIVPELAASAAQRLRDLGYEQVVTKQGDGYYGWPEYAPFDAIIVTAAPDHVPAPLVAQLKEGGRMVIPIGPPGGYQSLWKFVKTGGELNAWNMGGVAFVPLVGPGMEAPPTAATSTP